jgi:hypothetical protein
MNAPIPCRVTADLRRKMAQDDAGQVLADRIEARAREIVEEVEGYRKPPFAMDFTDFSDSLTEAEYRDFCDTYFAILFGIRDVGFDDMRQIDAHAYAMKWIEEWAEKRATSELMEEA